MTKRIILAALLAVAAPAFAQAPATPPAPVSQEQLVQVALETDQGRIVLALDKGRAIAADQA